MECLCLQAWSKMCWWWEHRLGPLLFSFHIILATFCFQIKILEFFDEVPTTCLMWVVFVRYGSHKIGVLITVPDEKTQGDTLFLQSHRVYRWPSGDTQILIYSIHSCDVYTTWFWRIRFSISMYFLNCHDSCYLSLSQAWVFEFLVFCYHWLFNVLLATVTLFFVWVVLPITTEFVCP